MIFEQRKIQTETLSEYLSQVRRDLNLPVQEVAEKSGLSPKFLTALETGQFKLLPADVYVYGFLRQLAALYSIDATGLIEQYKKESTIQQQLKKEVQVVGSWHDRYLRHLVITPKVLSLITGLVFVVVSTGYIIWQVWSINKTPDLNLSEPQNNSVVLGSSVEVVGKTDPGMTVTVNQQSIFVDAQGNFHTELGINPGPEQIVVASQNRFGRSFSQTVNIIGQPAKTASQNPAINLKVNFSSSVTLGVSIDGQPAQSFTFGPGDSKTFTGQQEIILSTSNAGATSVALNGQVMGAMGRPHEPLNNVQFFPSASSTTATSS